MELLYSGFSLLCNFQTHHLWGLFSNMLVDILVKTLEMNTLPEHQPNVFNFDSHNEANMLITWWFIFT